MTDIHICKSEETFKNLLKKAGSRLVVLHFEAEWALECSQMNEVLAELANECKHTVFIRVEAEEVADISQHYGIECVPTLILLRDLKILDKVEGADAASLTKKVKYHSTSYIPPLVQGNSQQSLEERLKKLINSSPCMLFMKGSPDTPRCGFSKQMIEILNTNNVKFGHFDILTDNEVREGLKKYSHWPTYPQFYINGELIGGLDIVKEIAENGELQDILPKIEDINTRLSNLVKKSRVMIFMKGDPQQPRCKFSKALMEILNPLNITFDSFDILQDEEVREGLKTFSNWPTYPQIYVNGELVGGLDIIRELHEQGELISTLMPGFVKTDASS